MYTVFYEVTVFDEVFYRTFQMVFHKVWGISVELPKVFYKVV